MRLEHWPELLADYLQAASGRPFAWGEHDCSTFAADWIEVCTGERPATPVCGSAAEFAALEREAGGMPALVLRALGPALDEPQDARRGDIALVPMDGRLCLGIVDGANVAGPGADGLRLVPRSEIVSAWSV